MIKISDLYERSEFLIEKLGKLRFKFIEQLSGFLYKETDYKNSEELAVPDDSWTVFKDNQTWGGKRDKHCWFYKKITVPKSEESGNYVLRFKTQKNDWDCINPQFTLYINGRLVQGLDINHTYSIIDESGELEVLLYAYSGTSEDGYLLFEASLEYLYYDVKDLYFDLKVPLDILKWSDKNSKYYIDTVKTFNETLKIVDFRTEFDASFLKTVKQAKEYIRENLYSKKGEDGKPLVSCIGHTHIDLAWQWTLEQTAEKGERSFATVMELMKRYPEFSFMASQPELYRMIKEYSPKLYEQIKQRIKEGRWVAEGSMYVEPDCNLTCGESLIRQIVYGKKFFKDEFGVENEILWLPDVFGYSACMPQIMVKSGIKYFLTNKISKNDVNQFPYDLFRWRGIDGSEILAYFVSTQDIDLTDSTNFTTYVGEATPSQIAGTYRRFQQKELTDNVTSLVGFGDGGGGVTFEMLETIRRLNNTDFNCPNASFVKPNEFFEKVHNDIKDKYVPYFQDELYLEFHRGTYTSVGKVKRNNRKAEILLHNLEYLNVLDNALSCKKTNNSKLNEAWRLLMLNQFHDILPGSSIKEVYERSDKDFARIYDICNNLKQTLESNISQKIGGDSDYLVFNSNGFDLSGNVIIDDKTVYVEDVPSNGYKLVKKQDLLTNNTIIANERVIENNFYKVEFDENYNISSIYDKVSEREIIKSGRKACFKVFEDFSPLYDNWEIRRFYTEKSYNHDSADFVAIVDDGVRKGLKIKYNYRQSTIIQTIYLYEKTNIIDFDTYVEWNEENVLLKFVLPVQINTDKAICNIQFGNIERPTNYNNSFNGAKFEVCAQKYASLSENAYCVSILNDCKYGYAFTDNDLSITLIKCSNFPYAGSDKGMHEFRYAITSENKSFWNSDVLQLSYAYNNSLWCIPANEGVKNCDCNSLISVNMPNVIVETVKPSEDGSGDVFRLYESSNMQTKAQLTFGQAYKKLMLCDMLENEISEIKIEDKTYQLNVKPYEIVTIKGIKTNC